MATPTNEKTIYLVDGSSFLYRSYYAMKPLHAPDGMPVQAVFGFARMIKKLIKDFQPHYFALVWDSKGTTVRHEIYPEYKAERQAAPTDLFAQKELIQEFADLINLHQVATPGIEADDLMASIAQDYAKKGYRVVVITSDKDLRQMVTENIVIFDPFKDAILDVAAVEKRYGIPIAKLPFYFALLGDSSDNIPGVRGIGPKGAEKLVQQFDSLKDLYQRLDEAGTERTKKLLLESKDDAFLSEKLFLLHYYTTDTTLEELAFDRADFAKAAPLFERLNFTSLLKEAGVVSAPAEPFAQRYGYELVAVTTAQVLNEMCAEIEKAGECAVDTETNAYAPMEATLVGVSLCCKQGKAYYIPVAHETGEAQLPREQIFEKLKPLLENKKIKKYLQNAKFDMHVLSNAGIELQGLAFETMVAAGLVKQDSERLSLKVLSEKYFNERMPTYKEVVTDHKYKNFAYVPLAQATDYAAADAHQTFKLVAVLQKELQEKEQERLFNELEMPLVQVLYAMEKEGIGIDVYVLHQLDEKVTCKLQAIVKKIADVIGIDAQVLNLNSPQQVSELLFEKLKLEPVKKTAGKTGYSTDQEVLAVLAEQHPVAGYIMEYRELFKLKSTYIDALPTYINKKTGRIHTTFKQTSVATGRLASVDPNLQNVPDAEYDLSVRAAFKADQGQCFIAADYSQMELRVLAYFSNDKNLMKAFLSGEDIHAHTAAGLFNVPLKEVTNEQRKLAKRINFSILYGMTPFGLSKDLGISQGQAKEYIEKYMAHYPQVKEWMEQVIEETKKDGYVTTWYGRRRYVPEIYEKNHALYQQGCRIAINTKAQGTAAEIVKLGMLQLQETFAKQLPDAKMLLQIHDELLIVLPRDQVEKGCEIVESVLRNVVTWKVPLEVTVRSGMNWEEVSK